jgi:TPP-dependent pyruvate/acetoin dehydrogenase alpha subunit
VVPCIFSPKKAPLLWWLTTVGGQIPVVCDFSLCSKYFETNAVTLTYFFVMVQLAKVLHEAFNMAMLWKFTSQFYR